jgi:hypothetical protein
MGNGMMCATTLKSRVAQGSAKCRLAGAPPPPPPTGAVGGGGALPRCVAVVAQSNPCKSDNLRSKNDHPAYVNGRAIERCLVNWYDAERIVGHNLVPMVTFLNGRVTGGCPLSFSLLKKSGEGC